MDGGDVKIAEEEAAKSAQKKPSKEATQEAPAAEEDAVVHRLTYIHVSESGTFGSEHRIFGFRILPQGRRCLSEDAPLKELIYMTMN